jgi:hypothetical protein
MPYSMYGSPRVSPSSTNSSSKLGEYTTKMINILETLTTSGPSGKRAAVDGLLVLIAMINIELAAEKAAA